MDILYYVLIASGAAVLLASMIFVFHRHAVIVRERRKTAFELTKKFGNEEIECVRIERLTDENRYFLYYMMEKGADRDSSKRLERFYTKKVWKKSNGKSADKAVGKIISQMPYSIPIEKTDESESDFFAVREFDRSRKEEEASGGYDKEKAEDIKRYLSGKKLRVVCHEEIDEQSKLITDYYYFLYVFTGTVPGVETYYYLFQCSKNDKEAADARVGDLISMIGRKIPFERSRITYTALYASEQDKIHGIWQVSDDYSEQDIGGER